MARQGGTLGRGRRTREQTPPVPDRQQLSELDRRAQTALQQLVDKAGGRWGIDGRSIDVDHVELLADLLEAWGRRNSKRDAGGHDYFPGRPGFWHALDELYPLQDPNRWDRLRLALTRELESRGPSERFAEDLRRDAVATFGRDGAWLLLSIVWYGWRSYPLGSKWSPRLRSVSTLASHALASAFVANDEPADVCLPRCQ